MKLLLLPFIFLATAAAAIPKTAGTNATDNLTVKTSTGIFTGLIDPQFPGTRQFRSIPFALPPTGSRRWLPPHKLSPSSKQYNSFYLPPSCPQFVSSVPSLLNQYFADGAEIYNGNENHTAGLVRAATSEDCLYLAIWTPANANKTSKLPVYFYMSGGGFSGGGINIPYQLPMAWIERSQSHIVISVNYRVNIFGFPNAPGLLDQNIGILDQRAALEWVRDNIVSFGGDPKKIVQGGQSAGSMSADVHAHAFYKHPIAYGYFLQSGTAFTAPASNDATFSNFSFVSQHFGCSSNVVQTDLACMRKIPCKNISNFIGQYGESGATPALSFTPVADERIVFSDYATRAREGKVAQIPAIISNTANEASSLLPFPASDPSAGLPSKLMLALDVTGFICPAYNSTLERNALALPVYRYQHAGAYPNMAPFPWVGAYHGNDIPMIFGTYDIVKDLGNSTQLEIETSRRMQDHVLAFLKDPWNGPKALGWKPSDARGEQKGTLLRFGTQGKAVQYVDKIEVDGVCEGKGPYDLYP